MRPLWISVGILTTAVLVGVEVSHLRRLSDLEQRLTTREAAASGERRRVFVTTQLDRNSHALKGERAAAVGLVVYSDFQCPFCARFATDVLPALERLYIEKKQVLFAFKHLPLQQIHLNANKLAEAATCAGDQGRFWPMHDVLFRRPPEINAATLSTLAGDIGLRREEFATCVLENKASVRVRMEAADAAAIGINSTPAIVIGTIGDDGTVSGELLRGVRPVAEFVQIIDRFLKQAGS